MHRLANEKPLLQPQDEHIVAIASDAVMDAPVPLIHLDDIPAIAAMMLAKAISLDDLRAALKAEL